jgi:hypothetical protein
MLSRDQKRRIRDEVVRWNELVVEGSNDGWMVRSPAELANRLPDLIETLTNQDSSLAGCSEVIAAVAAGALYGPRSVGEPPDEVVIALHKEMTLDFPCWSGQDQVFQTKFDRASELLARHNQTARQMANLLGGKGDAYLRRLVGREVSVDRFQEGVRKAYPNDQALRGCTRDRIGQLCGWRSAGSPRTERAGDPPVPEGLFSPERLLVSCLLATFQAQQLAVEKALVYGATRPPRKGKGWETRWEWARTALVQLIARLAYPALEWIGTIPLGISPAETSDWTSRVATAYANNCSSTLALGCGCWGRWQDFRIESVELAQHHCIQEHALSSWRGMEMLEEFLFTGVVRGALCLADEDSGRSARAMINDFRRGMLAKGVLEKKELQAGPVLRCEARGEGGGSRKRCPHEILPQEDQCQSHHSPGTKDPSWWLWEKGTRHQQGCCRCNNCDRLYFQFNGDCPRCGRGDRWAKRNATVWVEKLGNDSRPQSGGADSGPHRGEDDAEDIGLLLIRQIETWEDGSEKQFALLCAEGHTLAEVARELGYNSKEDDNFLQLLEKVIPRLEAARKDVDRERGGANQPPSDADSPDE